MLRKRLAQAVLVCSVLQGTTVLGLGLGEIAPETTLNQPFRAYIPLTDIGKLDDSQIKVNLATGEDFTRAGVERTGFLNDLEFTVDVDAAGRAGIIVTSKRLVTEPYLDFILEVRWPNGRILRNYTVLLDLPVFSDGPASTVSAPVVSTNTASSTPGTSGSVIREPGGARGPMEVLPPGPAPGEGRQPRASGEQTSMPQSAAGGGYRIQHNDTMWQLAAQFRPSGDVTTEQTLIALYNKNPDAFYKGNINNLKSGYVLQLPSEAEVKAINRAAAVKEISRQHDEWRGKPTAPGQSSATSSPAKPQINATASAEQEATEEAPGEARFSIAGADEEDESERVAALQNRIRQEQESLDQARLENESMQGRVAEMEKQIATLERLITLKNEQLAALQAGQTAPEITDEQLATDDSAVDAALAGDPMTDESAADVTAPDAVAQDDAAQSAPGTETDSDVVATNESDAGAEADVDEVSGDAESGSAESEPAPESVAEASAPPAAVPQVDEAVASNEPWYANPVLRYVGGGLLVLLLVLLGRRRRQQEQEQQEPAVTAFTEESGADEAAEAAVIAASIDALAGQDAVIEEDESTVSQFDVGALDDAPEEDSLAAADALEPDTALEPQTGDVLGEADIYIAYGSYEQAQSLLRNAIAKEPDNLELRLKLIDTYLDTRDRDNFDSAYAELQDVGDATAIDRVKESMSAMEGVSDWLGEESSAVAMDEPAADLADLDDDLAFLDDDDNDTTVVPGASAEPSNDIEFEPANFSDTVVEDEPAAAEADDAAAFSFDDELLDSKAEDAELDIEELASIGLGDNELGGALTDSSDDDGTVEFSLDDLDLDLDSLDAADSKGVLASDGEVASVDAEPAELDVDFDLGEDSAAADEPVSASADILAEAELDDLDLDMAELEELDTVAEPAAEAAKDEIGDDLDFDLDLDDLEMEADGEKPSAAPSEAGAEAESFSLDELDAELGDLSASLGGDPALDEIESELAGFDNDAPEARENEQQAAEELDSLIEAADADADGELAEVITPAESSGDELSLDDFSFDEFDADDSDDGDIGMLSDIDEVATKLDLARAYVDMGDADGAREMLEEVIAEGNDAQRADAQKLIDTL